jgi:hypothetical protein
MLRIHPGGKEKQNENKSLDHEANLKDERSPTTFADDRSGKKKF